MKYEIKVRKISELPDGIYEVTLTEGERNQEKYLYTVRVEADYVFALGWEIDTVAELVEESFAFLLEREAPASILKDFNLQAISQYFPEYEEVIGKK